MRTLVDGPETQAALDDLNVATHHTAAAFHVRVSDFYPFKCIVRCQNKYAVDLYIFVVTDACKLAVEINFARKSGVLSIINN